MKSERLAFGVEPSPAAYRLRLARYVDLAARIARLAGGRAAPPRLLDLGVGKGRLKAFYPPGSPPVEWTGLDVQDWRLREAGKVGGWRLVKGDGVRLPFRDGAFDVVVCCQVLEHFDDPDAALREARRVLAAGGTFLLSLPVFPPGAAAAAGILVRGLRAVPWIRRRWRGHVRFFSTRGVRRLVAPWFAVRDLRGFRLLSVLFLENFRLYYALNAWLGRAFPSLSVEVNCEAVKGGSEKAQTLES
ncbi:MAG: class I SAM-dependent methyltransferase [Planctomycetes bacterium]|nr:class I SAM-dependent methyltransferase [Planctomycetota bacterium]